MLVPFLESVGCHCTFKLFPIFGDIIDHLKMISKKLQKVSRKLEKYDIIDNTDYSWNYTYISADRRFFNF